MARNIFITNCGGEESTREIAAAFLREGGKLFELFRWFDVYLGNVEKTKNHICGSSIKYVLPFLKAAGVTDKNVRDFCNQNISIADGTKEMFASMREEMGLYIVNASYIHYVEEMATRLGVEYDHTYSTRFLLDDYQMGEREQKMFTGLISAFSQLPPVSWNNSGVLSPEGQFSMDSLKAFLFERLSTFPINQWLKKILLMSGRAKADAVLDITKRENVTPENIIYVGDNSTDMNALSLVREQGGLSISYNGDRQAVLSADYIIVSRDARILREIALTFFKSGKKGIKEGTTREGYFVCGRESCDIDNVISFSENMKKELQERP